MPTQVNICNIFSDVARTAATHNKHILNTRNIIHEPLFNKHFYMMLGRVLTAKKGNVDAKNVLEFVKRFLYSLESSGQANDQHALASLTTFLLQKLIKGVDSANKIVRYRVCQLIAFLLNVSEEMDDDFFCALKDLAIIRSKDKESIVRLQAGLILCRLQDGDEDLDIINALIDLLQSDTSADVRKSIIANASFTELLMPVLISRCRDIHHDVRARIFVKFTEENFLFNSLKLDDRLTLVSNGLSDRNPVVRGSCVGMIEAWLGQCNSDILTFLNSMQVMNNTSTSKEILKAYFYLPNSNFSLVFQQESWDNLTPEYAFLIQEYSVFCRDNQLHDKYDELLPELIRHIDYLKKYTEWMIKCPDQNDCDSLEFIVGQLLEISIYRDFSDEIGRRELLNFIRLFLLNTDASEDHIQIAVKSIRKISSQEMDFLRIIAEILYDIEEAVIESKDEKDNDVSKSIRTLKSLDIIKGAFYLCDIGAEENEPMTGILERFVLPSLQSPHMVIRCAGIECLGICCFLDKKMGCDNFRLFEFGFNSNDKQLVVINLKILLDMASVYGVDVFDSITNDSNTIVNVLKKALSCQEEDVLTTAVEGAAKLMLISNLESTEIVVLLFFMFYHPLTAEFKRIRQCLKYFFEMYSFSSAARQKIIQLAFPDVMKQCISLSTETNGMIPISHIVLQMLEWTDSKNIYGGSNNSNTTFLDNHMLMVKDLLEICTSDNLSVLTRRSLTQTLSKFQLDSLILRDNEQYEEIEELAKSLLMIVNGDLVSTNAVKRFLKMLSDMKTKDSTAITHENGNEIESNNLEKKLAELEIEDEDDEEEDVGQENEEE